MTTTDTLPPLAVGDRVTYRGHEGIVTEPNTTDGGMSGYVLLGFTPGDGPAGAWEDRGYPEGKRYYWVHREDDGMTRITPRQLQVGDVVDASRGAGETRRGVVYATQGAHEGSPLDYVWVGGMGEPWRDESPYTYVPPDSYAGSHRVVMPHDSVVDEARGRWYYLNTSAYDDVVTLVTPSTTDEAPSEAAQAPEDSPEVGGRVSTDSAPNEANPAEDSPQVTALKADVERLQRQNERQRSQISAMQNDVRLIGEALKETADRHEWCGEYERHLEELLGVLSSHTDDILREAAQRLQTYTVTYTYTTTVDASSRDEAEETVRECHDWTSYGDWETEED